MSEEPGRDNSEWILVVIILAMIAQFALLLLSPGCAPLPPPVPPPASIPGCPQPPVLAPERVCLGLFTEDGLPCVNCGPDAAGCFHKASGVYCVSGSCLDDLACKYERNDVLGRRRR